MSRMHQAGMSLVELLVAMVIGLFLSAGIIEVLSANKRTNRFVESLSTEHQNIRFAIDFIAEQLRSAGFAGCNSDADLRVHLLTDSTPRLANVCANGKCYPADMLDILTVTSGYGQRPYSYGNSSIRMPIGSAAIGFYRSEPTNCGATTDTVVSQSTTALAVSPPCDFGQNPYLMLATCSGLSVIQVSDDTAPDEGDTAQTLPFNGYDSSKLPFDFPVGTDVYRLTGSLFYVACRTSDDSDCGLFYDDDMDDAGNPQELVPGVADMRALYGVDTDSDADGGADTFVDDPSTLSIAGVDNSWHRVVSLRIAFLTVSSEDNLVDGAQSYTFPPWATSPTTPTDRRIRNVYTTSVALRNRIANLRNNL